MSSDTWLSRMARLRSPLPSLGTGVSRMGTFLGEGVPQGFLKVQRLIGESHRGDRGVQGGEDDKQRHCKRAMTDSEPLH